MLILSKAVVTGPGTFVQKGNSGSGRTAATAPATFAGAQTLGHTNIVFITYGKTGGPTVATVSSVTDTATNTYVVSPIGFITHAAGSDSNGSVVWYCSGIKTAGAGNIVTVNLSASVNFLSISVLQYSGLGAIDVTASNTAIGGSAITAGPVTTTQTNDLLIGCCEMYDGAGSIGAGFTSRDLYYTVIVEDQIAATVGAYNLTASSAGTGAGWSAHLLAFKHA